MSRKSAIYYLTIGTPTVALAGAVVLSLLGYGAAGAIESVFGVPRELVYDSPLDLLHLASYAIAGCIEALNGLWESLAFMRLSLAMFGVGLAATLLLLVCRISILRRRMRALRGTVSSAARKLPGRNSILSCVQWLCRERLCLIPLGFFSIFPWLCVLLMTLVVLSFSLLPAVGFSAAKKDLHSWIVASGYCTPLSTRDERLGPDTSNESARNSSRITPCLSLWKNGSLIAEGRHVASTDSHIILFDPKSGGVRIEPVDGVSVRVSGMPIDVLRRAIKRAHVNE